MFSHHRSGAAVMSALLALSLSLAGCSGDTIASIGTPDATGSATQSSTQSMTTGRIGSVTASPTSLTIVVGAQAPISATVKDSKGNIVSSPTLSWSSSNASVAAVSASGVVTAVAIGSAKITVLADNKRDFVDVTVVADPNAPSTGPVPASIAITVPSTSLYVGQSEQATAVVKDASGTVIPNATVSWATSSAAVLAVSSGGVALGESAGTASLSASSSGITQSVGLSVMDTSTTPSATVSRVSVTLSSSTLAVGATTQATATAYDAGGQVVSGQTVSWSSTNASVASVTSAGLVTAAAAGSATINATVGGVSGGAALTVATATVPSSCSAYPYARVVSVASSTQLSTALQYARPGDLILLADGRYAGHFNSSVAGLPGQRITLCGTRNAIIDGGSLSTGGYALTIRASYWVLDGFTVTNTQQGVRLEGSSRSTVRRLAIYNIGQEAFNNRKFSVADTVESNEIYDTGRVTAEYGEGIYVGSYNGVWATLTGGLPDRTDSTVVRNNVIGPNVTAEAIDVKEGTTGGLVVGNSFDGRGMVMSQTWVDSWVEIKGNGYRVLNNNGKYTLRDGFQAYNTISGWGNDNTFSGNVGDLQSTGYGFRISGVTGTTVSCDNVATTAGSGLSNIGCK